jgi:hypothetical protein
MTIRLKAALWPNGEFKVTIRRNVSPPRASGGGILHPLHGIEILNNQDIGLLEVRIRSRKPDGTFYEPADLWQDIGWWRPDPKIPTGPQQLDLLVDPPPESCPYIPRPPFDLSLPVISEKISNRNPRGQSGITGHGRRLVRNAAELVQGQDWFGKCSFATLTLPGDAATGQISASDLDEIKRGVIRNLVYHLEQAGLPAEIVAVWELQPARWNTKHQAGWHLHLVFRSALERFKWLIDPATIRKIWHKLVCDRVPSLQGESWGGSCDIKMVRKSASGYIGKYLSKGGKFLREILESGLGIELPHSWYAISGSIRTAIKDCKVEGELVGWQLQHLILSEDSANGFRYLFPLISPIIWNDTARGDPGPIGWVGQLTRAAYNEIKKFIEEI